MKYTKEIIKHNRLQCNKCKDIIESLHGWHFITCKCGSISADGGKEYLRRVGDINNYTELSEVEYKEVEIPD